MAFTLRFISLVNHESVDALEIDFRISSFDFLVLEIEHSNMKGR